MNSRESEYSHWQQYGDRGTRQKEKRRHDGDLSRDDYHGYDGEAQASMKRTRGNWEYHDLPESSHSKESLNRDWRRSPARRSLSSPPRITPDKDIDMEREYANRRNEDQELLRKKKELQLIEDQINHKKAALAIKQFSTSSRTSPKQSISKKKRRKFTEGDEEDFKFEQSPEDFTHRQPPNDQYRQRPEDFKCRQPPKEFKQRQLPEEDFKYRQPPKEFKQRQLPEEDFKYKKTPKEFKQRQLPEDDFEYRQPHKEFKQRHLPEDDFKHRKPPKEFKQRQLPEEDFKYRKMSANFKHRQQHEDFTHRQPLKYHTDEPFKGRNNDDLWDRTQAKEFPPRVHTKPRERNDYHYPDYDYEDRQNRMKCPTSDATRQANGQVYEPEQDVTNQGAGLSWGTDEHNTAEKGFQRFLSVLNKGVDIGKLTNIVCRAPGEGRVPPHSQTSLHNTVDPPWSHSGARQGESQTITPYRGESQTNTPYRRESHTNIPYRRESQRSGRENSGQDHIDFTSEERTTELPCQKGSIAFQGHTLSHEKSLPRNDAGGSSEWRSPLEVEKSKVKPEDEQKCRQMQDVLQAIGMDLGLEELGLMSNRIQERLYGRRDSEKRESDKDRETRRVYSPRRHSRSLSSGNSGFGQLTQQHSLKKDLSEAPRDITNVKKDLSEPPRDGTDVNQTFEHSYTGGKSSNISLQDTSKEGNKSQQSTVAPQTSFSHNPTYPPTYPSYPTYPPYPPYPTYPPYPPYPTYPMPPPQAAPIMPPYPPGQYSPWGMNLGAMPYPPFPPTYPPPSVPPLNNYVTASSQKNTHHQVSSTRQLTYVNLQGQNPVQPVNTTQTTPTVSRPRCLQVIGTDRPQQTKMTITAKIENKSVSKIAKTMSQGVEFKKMSHHKQRKFRKWLYYSGKLKVIHQRKMAQARLNDATEKSIVDLIQLARLKAARKSAAKSQGKVLGDRKKKKTIKLRLLVNEAGVKSSGGAECSGMHCESDERTETCSVGGEQSAPVE